MRPVRNALGLIGYMCTGKTTYLATLHDQLMHSAPEWDVEVRDSGFSELTRNYRHVCEGLILPTLTSLRPYIIKVRWHGRDLELLMWDIGGEVYQSPTRAQTHVPLLDRCRSIMVTINSFEHIAGASDQDQALADLFHWILEQKPALRRVVVLLVGVDVYGPDPSQANDKARSEFESKCRVFPGVLKNAGIQVETVPLSNIGFGNKDQGHHLTGPPRPYNVLEPLRRAFPAYLPWWQRLSVARSERKRVEGGSLTLVAEPQASQRSGQSNARTAFVSYRREGGAETARLIRSELQARGWQVFLDVEDLGASRFDGRILLEIQNAACFILILSSQSLERVVDERDWVRREIAHAISRKRHVVPVLKEGFTFPAQESLPEEIRELSNYNSVKYSNEYFGATIDKLVSFLDEAEC